MRILSWNILHGGGQRSQTILDAIGEQQADIVVLQEFRRGKNADTLLRGLASFGLEQQHVPPTASARENTLLVASCFPFKPQPFPVQEDLAQPPIRCLRAHFTALPSTDVTELDLIVAHLPHKKLQIPYFESMLDIELDSTTSAKLIIGDLNCGIPFEDSETQSFYATRYFQQLLQNGWIDAWRIRNKEVREYSWISTKKKNGFRYDHALVTEELNTAITEVRYNHGVREASLSDHSMLCIDI